jgi:hypothetical protein
MVVVVVVVVGTTVELVVVGGGAGGPGFESTSRSTGRIAAAGPGRPTGTSISPRLAAATQTLVASRTPVATFG